MINNESSYVAQSEFSFFSFLKEKHNMIYKMIRIWLILTLSFLSVLSFSQTRYVSQTTKKIVFTRDGGKCNCCGSSQNLEYDHIIPFSCGGQSVVSNIQLLCQKCNRSKSNSCYCKIHNKKVGNNCCDGNSIKKTSSSSKNSITRNGGSTSSQCSGITQKGERCRKRTTNPSGRCYLH